MKCRMLIGCGFVLAVAVWQAGAATNTVQFADIEPLLRSGRPSANAAALALGGPAQPAPESPRFTQTPDGYLESLGAAPGTEFPAAPAPAGQPEVTAKNFLKQHGRLFGVTSPSVDFKLRKKNSGNGRHSIRLTQTYEGIPVFGGEMVVQVNDAGGVEYVAGNFDRDTSDLDEKRLATKPQLTAGEAAAAAQAYYAPKAPGQALAITPPELNLFVPALLKMQGPKRLTWRMEVRTADQTTVAKRAFIDARSGEFVQDIPLLVEFLNRRIYDHNNTRNTAGVVVRSEGGVPAALAEANAAYDFLGDTYNFYYNRFGRDGISNDGASMYAHVRYCDSNQSHPCPLANAYGGGSAMYFGQGYTADDVCAHELTHGVTAVESMLIYANESGAINESMSDVFGEYVDLTNTGGNDSAAKRWLIGEDVPGGPFRSMTNPPAYSGPDWLGSSLYQPRAAVPTGENDYGGVHSNGGVNNKLCCLLTDGGRFRGHTITAMEITPVAALYYEANVNLLTASSGWTNLASALKQAAINLNWSISQRQNLDNAIAAVGLLLPRPFIYIDAALGSTETGTPTQPAHSINKGVSLLGAATDGTLILRGTGHTNRISRKVTIQTWDGTARIEP